MCILNELSKWNWPVIIQSIASVLTVAIAFIALNSWKKQRKSQIVTNLLDSLTDNVHEFIQSINNSVQQVSFIFIGIDSYKHAAKVAGDPEFSGVIKYIRKNGKSDADVLIKELQACKDPLKRIKSLLVKGQVFEIVDFEKCKTACDLVTWQYDRIQAIYALIVDPNKNWENPKVKSILDKVLQITSASIEEYLTNGQTEFHKFIKDFYSNEFKNA